MPRKSLAAELQAEEAVASSPLRRSSRIVTGNGTIPAGVTTRRTSQTTEPKADTPARATRGRRASAQDSEEKIETKPVPRTRRGSVVAEEEPQKETVSTPARRGRKPSVTTEPTEKEDLEKPKPVRGRRNSAVNTNEETVEEKPVKTALVRGRRSSANVEPETDVKVAPKTPARAATRRRSSATENTVIEEVSAPSRRTARGRKASDTDEIVEVTEEVKKPAKGRRKSVNVEEDSKSEETAKPAGGRARKASTDGPSANAVPKTPGKPRGRPSINKEATPEESPEEMKEECSEMQKAGDDSGTEEEMSPIILTDVSVRITPLKKRKIVEKMEVELDLSIINESADDMDNSKHDESSKKTDKKGNEQTQLDNKEIHLSAENVINEELNLNTQAKLEQEDKNMSTINKNLISGDETKKDTETLELSSEISATSTHNSTSSKKRLSSENDDNSSPRKSPRLSERLSRNNTPTEEGNHQIPTPKRSRNLVKENEKEVKLNEKSLASFVSSGSDGSFKFHMSNISMNNSNEHNSNKENTQGDLLNTSTESTGSNKENIEQIDSSNVKTILDISALIPVQEPIVIARVSNVFKPNQREYSFMEPMEVEEDSIIGFETSVAGTDQNASRNLQTAEVSMNNFAEKTSDLDESSILFNYKKLKEKSTETTQETSSNQPKEAVVSVLELAEETSNQNSTETEYCDSNLIIEETKDSVDFSIKHETEKSEIPLSTSIQERPRIPLIINQPLEQAKVVLLGKSSSPITAKRRSSSLRKSKSPVPKNADSTDSENGEVPRRSKSKSRSPRTRRSSSRSPSFRSVNVLCAGNEAEFRNSVEKSGVLMVSQRSKSKSKTPSPVRVGGEQVNSRNSKSPLAKDGKIFDEKRSTRSKSKSPLPGSQETPFAQDNENLKVKEALRSRSKSPLLDPQNTPVAQERKKLNPRKSIVLNSPSQDSQEIPVTKHDENLSRRRSESQKTPIIQNNEKLSPRRSIRSRSKSPLPKSQSPVTNDNDKLRRKSKSPLSESEVLEQSFEGPKGVEEVMVTNERKSKEPSENMKTKSNVVPDSLTTNFSETAETDFDISDMNYTGSELTNMQDKTEYHVAIATTDNESDFNNIINTETEITGSQIKDSESAYYDFAIDSDDDDLLPSKNGSGIVCIETSALDEQTPALQKELKDESQVVTELNKYSARRSKSPRNEKKQIKIAIDALKLEESNEVSVSAQVDSDETSDSVKADIDEQKSHTDSTKNISEDTAKDESSNKQGKAILTQEGQGEDLDKQLQEIIISSTEDINEDNRSTECKSDSDKTKESACTVKLIVDDKNINKNIEIYTQKKGDKTDIFGATISVDQSQDGLDCSLEAENEKRDCVEAEILEDEKRGQNNEKEEPLEKNIEKVIPSLRDEGHSEIGKGKDLNTSSNSGDLEGLEDIIIEVYRKAQDTMEDKKKSEEKAPEYNVSTEMRNDKDNKKTKTQKKNQKHDRKGEPKIEESVEIVSTCRMAAQKVDVSKYHDSSPRNKKSKLREEDSKSTRTKPTLDEFASLKLEEYLGSKAGELIEESSSEEEEEEESVAEYNEFIDGMAEEGEEDTPSEDSNEIIDEGESVGFSSNEEISDDDYDANDSFICDEEEQDLLPGDEYDLGNEKKDKKTKKSRIIDPNTLGEENIIKIPKKKKTHEEKPKRRSRIISVSDSSDEEQLDDSVFEIKEESDKEDADQVGDEEEAVKMKKDPTSDASIILIESSKYDESDIKESENSDANKPIVIEKSKNIDDSEAIITLEPSEIYNSSKDALSNKSDAKDIDSSVVTEESNREFGPHNMSFDNLNASLQKGNRKSSLSIQENIVVDGKKDPMITKRISSLVESFCSTVKKGEIAFNLSLEYEDTTSQENDKTHAVQILSDIQICSSTPNQPLISEEEQEGANLQEETEEQESKLSVSLNEAGDMREVINRKTLKRRLSTSVEDLNEEVKAAKRRKKHKINKDKQNAASEEKLPKATTSKTKKRNKTKVNPTEELHSAISSFSIMNQLVTDVKNRPKRVMKPTKSDVEVESAWTTTIVTNLKPSTSPVTKQEKIRVQPIQPKLHPKDFKNRMLSNDRRVRRIDTKTLLKKKGAYL